MGTIIVGAVGMKELEAAHELLAWTPPDLEVIVQNLRGDARRKGIKLDLKDRVREKWVKDLLEADQDRRRHNDIVTRVRQEIALWLAYYTSAKGPAPTARPPE